MPSVQRFLSGRDNLARTAVLAASSVRASTAIERVAAHRSGGGRVRLAGAYTGHEAAEVQVQVMSAGGVPRASVPQFVGVGNGRLAVAAVDAGAPLQQLTLTLADLGVATAHAALDVREVQLRARTPGAAGNAVRVSVAPRLVRTPTPWALLADWPAGTAVQTGPQWDFGGLPLSAQQTLAEDSPRIAFGHDPQVYRPWREFKDGAWRFGLSPALERTAAAGTPVYGVTGGYVVTVTDGVATETYGDEGAGQAVIRSFHELLLALAASALVEVAGVVVADRTVGGQAAIDVPLRTQAWLLALAGKVDLADVRVPPGAPTQALRVRCINDDVVGAERWSVAGDVSGALAVAVTGQPYESEAAAFTVPRLDPTAPNSGRWAFKYEPAPRGEDEGVPSVCLRPFRLGRNAVPRTVTFRYQKRPPADCRCSDVPAPRLSLKCLGLTEGADMALDAEYQQRLEALYEWRAGFMAANALPGPSVPRLAPQDMDLADAVVAEFVEALAQIYTVPTAATEWDAALTDMRDELEWLKGFSDGVGSPGSYRTVQGGRVGDAYQNNAMDRSYRLEAVRRNGVAAALGPTMDEGDEGFTDAYSPVWTTDDTPFTITVTVQGVEWAFDYVRGRPVGSIAVRRDVAPEMAARVLSDLPRRYLARMDYVRTLAGIVPKSDSSSGDAGGCWIDHGGTHWWVDADGYYLPAFTNEAYVSARRDTDTGKPYSTMEFGFGLVVACPERLRVGDEIRLRIESVDGERPYRVGDEAVIQTVGAGPAWLAGGVDGTDVQTWRVVGDVSGVLPDYEVPTDGAPVPAYGAAGVTLGMQPGGIAFALGDTFTLAVEAGQFQWRRGGGAWSAVADIPASGQAALADGLSVHFDAGAAPSFVPEDAYVFEVHQPWAASHVQSAAASGWGWAGDAAQMVLDLGAVRALGALALARYALPAGAVVTAELSDDGVVWGAPVALDVSGAVCVHFLRAEARHVRLSVSGAAGGRMGWVWVGEPMATDHHASSCQRRRQWAAQRGEGVNPASLYAGLGDGWRLAWQPGEELASMLLDADVARLVGLMDWAQQHDEPLLFVPHHLHPQDAALVRVAADALELTDVHEWQPDDASARLLSAELQLEPVFA
ncbi:MAG: hypothetical protein Q4G71_03740 [Pseudomonadota bacterium]|nr:hypothetical protein [Pseudomonadota bacterium]